MGVSKVGMAVLYGSGVRGGSEAFSSPQRTDAPRAGWPDSGHPACSPSVQAIAGQIQMACVVHIQAVQASTADASSENTVRSVHDPCRTPPCQQLGPVAEKSVATTLHTLRARCKWRAGQSCHTHLREHEVPNVGWNRKSGKQSSATGYSAGLCCKAYILRGPHSVVRSSSTDWRPERHEPCTEARESRSGRGCRSRDAPPTSSETQRRREGANMSTREATAEWRGGLKSGTGTMGSPHIEPVSFSFPTTQQKCHTGARRLTPQARASRASRVLFDGAHFVRSSRWYWTVSATEERSGGHRSVP